jgi:hypothetical protein
MVDKLFERNVDLAVVCRHFENQTIYYVARINNVSSFSFDTQINVIFPVKVGTV